MSGEITNIKECLLRCYKCRTYFNSLISTIPEEISFVDCTNCGTHFKAKFASDVILRQVDVDF